MASNKSGTVIISAQCQFELFINPDLIMIAFINTRRNIMLLLTEKFFLPGIAISFLD
ncbi:MAG TPA: hypothetical protein VIJ92_07300 [Ginsengibacter sp.]